MNRTQIIFELARYCHPSYYHKILNWPTEGLEKLLDHYQQEKKEMVVNVTSLKLNEKGVKLARVLFKYPIRLRDGKSVDISFVLMNEPVIFFAESN